MIFADPSVLAFLVEHPVVITVVLATWMHPRAVVVIAGVRRAVCRLVDWRGDR